MTCTKCEKRSSCESLCSQVREVLPSMRRGVYLHEVNTRELFNNIVIGKRTTRTILDYIDDERLSEKQRELLRLYYIQQLSSLVISKQLGRAAETIREGLNAARCKIAKLVKKDRQNLSM